MKVVESIWFSNIGIVKLQDENGNITFRIGTGHGFDQKMDEEKIKNWGNTFTFFRTD